MRRMKGLVTLCIVISWTVISGTVLAQNEVDYKSDKNQADLEELSKLLKEEELIRTNLNRITNVLYEDDNNKKDEVDICGDGVVKCPKKSSTCAGDAQSYYCRCIQGFRPKNGDEINNREGCIDEYECGNDVCTGDNQQCVPKGNAHYCKCNEGYEEEDIESKGTTNIICKSATHVCKDTDCKGENTKCVVAGNDYTCDCKDGFIPKDDTKKGQKDNVCVVATHVCKDTDCKGENTKCVVAGNDYTCDCKDGFIPKDDTKKGQKDNVCVAPHVCKDTDCKGENTECVVAGNDYTCECKDGFIPKDANKKGQKDAVCIEATHVCKDTDCTGANTECVTKGSKYICECKNGFKPKDEAKKGQKDAACIEKTKCDLGDYTCPMPERAKCVMIGTDDYYCECISGYVPKEGEVKENKKECTSGCDKGFCQKGSTCQPQGKDYKCICAPFFEGKNCTVASCTPNPCKNGGKCAVKEINSVKKGECTCKAPFAGDICETNSWCLKNICGKSEDVECKFSDNLGVGYCQCKNDTLRFNYASKSCEDKPVCLNKICQKNEVCDPNTNECKCKAGYDPDTETKTCKSKLCENTCFEGSKCTEVGNDAIKCSCNSSQYYVNNECKDARCLLSNLRSNCEQECPVSNMKRVGGICKPVKSDEEKTIIPCTLSCGPFGYCYKDEAEDAKETCVCIEEAQLTTKDEKAVCELKESVCPSGIKLTKDKNRCNCTGKFKDSSANKITCDLKTCSDKDVQEECKKRNAVCVQNWKSGDVYECKCKEGYLEDPKSKICLYVTSILDVKADCSKDNKVAFMDQSGQVKCMCPPGLKSDTNNGPCTATYKDKSTYLINKLPISKTKYVHDSVVDTFALTKDVISAMMQTFKDLEFARLYKYKIMGDVIECSVWLQFIDESEFDYNRIPMAAFEDGFLLPGLQLKKEKINEVKGDKLKLCSGQEHDPFCGATTCDKDVCKCPEGYKIVDASIKKYGVTTLFTCGDVNECSDGLDTCPQDSTACVNTEGSFYCRCLPKYKLKKDQAEMKNQEGCIGACEKPNPCNAGQCSLTTDGMVDCSCNVGYSGSYCTKNDVALAGANKKTVVVGAVLGTFLGIFIIAVVVYVIKQRKNSYSEDFSPAPRLDNAEMTERRPMRGISNRAYQ